MTNRNGTTRHVVMMSGGLSSYETLRRTVARYGAASVVALFANTRFEDRDLYRFLREAAAHLGVEIVEVSDPQGRNPFDVFDDVGFLGNSRLSPCSKILKQIPAMLWLIENCEPASTIVYIGIGWDEQERIPGIRSGHSHTLKGCRKTALCKSLFTEEGRLPGPGCGNLLPEADAWRVEFILTEPPYFDRDKVVAELAEVGIAEPAMYREGYAHNNCQGLCVKAGQAQWALTLRIHPDRYAYAEEREQRFRREKNPKATILRDWSDGGRPLTLTEFRERIEAQNAAQPSLLDLIDENDWGGCGCYPGAA
ncbi:hypothetical protein AB0K53_01145 [Streptomyces tuirus]|uniref:hypothetical protein n=1 Tax=Streptomyces tuirus TaxID=68278 RepID=UPI003413FAE6